MLTEASDYETLYRNFRWEIPARFNIATACCDRHADGSGRLALIYVDEDGAATRTSFDEVAEQVAPLCQCAEAGRPRARRPRRGVSVAVAGIADRASGGVSIRPGVDPAVRACSARTRWNFVCRIPTPRPIVTDADRLGEAGKNPRPAAGPARTSIVIGDGAPAGTTSFWSAISQAASPDFATVDTSADDPALIIYTSGTTGNPKGALHAHRVVLGHLPNVEMCHDFLPKPGDLMWTPADWAWIGGLINALLAGWYHGVPIVGHRARKFEPQAAMAMMADYGIRNVFLPPTALKLMRIAGRQTSRRQAAQHFYRRGIAGRRVAGLGARDLRHRRP